MTSSHETDYVVKKMTTISYNKKTDYMHQALKGYTHIHCKWLWHFTFTHFKRIIFSNRDPVPLTNFFFH